MWCIVIGNEILAEFETATEAYEATYTGEFPDVSEVVFINM